MSLVRAQGLLVPLVFSGSPAPLNPQIVFYLHKMPYFFQIRILRVQLPCNLLQLYSKDLNSGQNLELLFGTLADLHPKPTCFKTEECCEQVILYIFQSLECIVSYLLEGCAFFQFPSLSGFCVKMSLCVLVPVQTRTVPLMYCFASFMSLLHTRVQNYSARGFLKTCLLIISSPQTQTACIFL